jgi:PAS domain S-box-containing protein
MGESEIPFSVLAAAAADGVILIDEESSILFVNPAAGQLFGYEPAQMVGKPLLQASAEAIVRHLDAAFARIWMLNTSMPAVKEHFNDSCFS